MSCADLNGAGVQRRGMKEGSSSNALVKRYYLVLILCSLSVQTSRINTQRPKMRALRWCHPFMHTFTHLRRSQPRRATASWSEAVRVRRLAQGHLNILTLGGARDQNSNLLVTSQPAVPPGTHASHKVSSLWCVALSYSLSIAHGDTDMLIILPLERR